MDCWNPQILLYLAIWAQVILVQVKVFVRVHFYQNFPLLILTGPIAHKEIMYVDDMLIIGKRNRYKSLPPKYK